jgi:phage/plasmid-associated DNA primase
MQRLLGPSAAASAGGVFLVSGAREAPNAHTSHFDALDRLRLAYLPETATGTVLSSDNIKRITGGDQIANRAPFERNFEQLVTQCHLILATQHLPRMDTSDQAMMKRARVINFRSWFKPAEATYSNPNALKIYDEDKQLYDKLLSPECLNAILTMFSIAARKYYADKYEYHIPQQIYSALNNYSADSFVYIDFIRDCCKIGPKYKVSAKALYDQYFVYAGSKADSNRVFKSQMEKRYIRKKSNTYQYFGIDLDMNKINKHVNMDVDHHV